MEEHTQEGALQCYSQHLFRERIRREINGKMETVGRLTVCARRFMREKPAYINDPIQSIDYSLPDCKKCVRELTSFRDSITINLDMAGISRNEAREWLSAVIRSGCRDFTYSTDWRKRIKPCVPEPTIADCNTMGPEEQREPLF